MDRCQGCVCGGNIEPGSPATPVPAKCCTTGTSLGAGQAQLRVPCCMLGPAGFTFSLEMGYASARPVCCMWPKGWQCGCAQAGGTPRGAVVPSLPAGPGARVVRELPGATGPVAPFYGQKLRFLARSWRRPWIGWHPGVVDSGLPFPQFPACTHAASGTFSLHRVVLPSQMCGTQAKGFLLAQVLDPVGA